MVNGISVLCSRKGAMATRPGVNGTIGRRATFISAPATGRWLKGTGRPFRKSPLAAWGRLHSVAIGGFREAQIQGPLFGDEPGNAAGMSRPIDDIGDFLGEWRVHLVTRRSRDS